MYGEVLSAVTVTSGAAAVAVLPETGVNPVFTYAAVTAIVIGSVALLLQIGAAVYRRSLRSK